jgi:hypothetical protein
VRHVVALVAAAALAAACSQAPVAAPIPSCAPSLIPGYPDAGIYYVRDYAPKPEPPSGKLMCFSSVLDAIAAGLRPAPPPPGGVLTDDAIYLVAADQALHATCVRAAALARFAIPCPGLVPMHRAAVNCPTRETAPNAGGPDCLESAAGSSGGRVDAFIYGQSDMVLPDTYVGTAPSESHIWIIGVRADSTLAPPRASCATSVPEVPGPEIFDRPSVWLECPDGTSLHSGHTVLRWSGDREDVLYAVSLHGYGPAPRRIALALANAIVLVGPPP